MPKPGTWFTAGAVVDAQRPNASVTGRVAETLVWPPKRKKPGWGLPQTATFREQFNQSLLEIRCPWRGVARLAMAAGTRAKPNDSQAGNPDMEH